jgi:hypothetical protein
MLQPRQQYGLGSLVKSAVKGVTGAVKGVASGIKDFAKSDLGKAAIMAGIGFGIPGTSFGGLFGRAGFGGNALGLFGKEGIAATLSGIPGAAKAAQFLGGEKTLGKTLGVFAGGSLLGGLLSKAEQGDPNAMQATRDVGALRNYLTSGYENLGYSAEEIPALVEKDVSEYSSIGGYANGGRIGFANGVTPELMKRINAIIKEIESKPEVKEEEKKPSKLQEQIKKDLEKRHMQDIVVMEKKAYGGRIGYEEDGIMDMVPREQALLGGIKKAVAQPVSGGDTSGGGFGEMRLMGKLIQQNPEMFRPASNQQNPQMFRSASNQQRLLNAFSLNRDFIDLNENGIDDRKEAAYGGRIGYAGGGTDETPEEKMFREMKNAKVQAAIKLAGEKNIGIGKAMAITNSDDFNLRTGKYEGSDETIKRMLNMKAYGGRIGYMAGTPEGNAIQASGVMGLPLNQNKAGVTELDLRNSGGFIPPVGVKEKADDIPAMLSNNEFVFTADAVRGMGNGDVNKGAQRMYDMMKKLEKGGRV